MRMIWMLHLLGLATVELMSWQVTPLVVNSSQVSWLTGAPLEWFKSRTFLRWSNTFPLSCGGVNSPNIFTLALTPKLCFGLDGSSVSRSSVVVLWMEAAAYLFIGTGRRRTQPELPAVVRA